MPTFEVTSPDGRKFQVNGPEGSTMEQAIEYAKNNLAKQPVQKPESSRLGELGAMVTDIPSQIGKAYQRPVESIKEFGEFARTPEAQNFSGDLGKDLSTIGTGLKKGAGAIGSAMYLGTGLAPAAEGVLKSLYGHGMSAIFGPEKLPAEQAMGDVDTAAMLISPGKAGAKPIPARPATEPFGLTTPKGPIPKGTLSPAASERVKDFSTQQEQQLKTAKETLARGMDPYRQGMTPPAPISSAVDAGDVVQKGVQYEAARAKKAAGDRYEYAKTFPGQVEPAILESIVPKIQSDLELARTVPVRFDNPVSEKLYPHATSAMKFLEQESFNEVPRTLEELDQVRRVVSQLSKKAFAAAKLGGDYADATATLAVLDALDARVATGLKSGFYKGDQRAPQAWLEARQLHSEYRKTFRNRRDPVARTVEEIVGSQGKDPKTPNDVIDAMIGSGVNPTSKQVSVFRRVKSILGADSAEMAAVRQGTLQRLMPEGATPAQIQANLERFLKTDGKELANEAFSPQQRALLQRFADVMPRLEVATQPTSPEFIKLATAKMLRRLGWITVAAIAMPKSGLAPWMLEMGAAFLVGGAAEKGISSVSGLLQANKVAKALPLVSEELAKWQKAVASAQRSGNRQQMKQMMFGTIGLQKALQSVGIAPAEIFGEQPTPAQATEPKRAYGGPQE